MRPRLVAVAALAVGLAGVLSAARLDEEPLRYAVVADPATARPGLTPLGFTVESVDGPAFGELDAQGRVRVAAYVADDCTTLPDRLWRTATGDLVLRSHDDAAGTCGDNGGPSVSVRLTLSDGPVRPGTALLPTTRDGRAHAYGRLLLRGSEPVPLVRPAARDCGSTQEGGGSPADPAKVRCLAGAARTGAPAVLRVLSTGIDDRSQDTYEVVGPGRVRYVSDSRGDAGLGGSGVLVAPCERFLGVVDGYLRTASCASSS